MKPQQAQVISELLQNMAYDVTREVIKEELKDEENRLKEFRKRLIQIGEEE